LDLLCVNQVDTDDKQLQVQNMPNIYKNAETVLVMFGGCAAAQGLEHSSPWIERAWTLQESTVNKNTCALIDMQGLPHIETHVTCNIASVSATISRLDGDIGVVNVHQLLKVDIGRPLGRILFSGVANDLSPYCDLYIRCFGEDPQAIQIMQIIFDGIHSDGENNLALMRSAAWMSIWTRTSTRPQDMVFSLMHLLGVELTVNYSRSLESLFLELVKKSSLLPVWLSIVPHVGVIPGSGLIPVLPEFRPHSLPMYSTRHSEELASIQLIDLNLMVGCTDLVINPSTSTNGFELCGTVMDVHEIKEHGIIQNAVGKSFDLSFSTAEATICTHCIVFKKVGRLAVVAGQQWKKTSRSDFILDLSIIFLDRVPSGEREKVGQGLLAIKECEMELLTRVKRRHVKVGSGSNNFKVNVCDCWSGRNKGQFRFPRPYSDFRFIDEENTKVLNSLVSKDQFTIVPYERNPHFKGRKDLLERLHVSLNEIREGQWNHRVALYGLGGVGKTQIALEYCFRYKNKYDYVFWMSAADETRLLSSYREVATLTNCVKAISKLNSEEIVKSVIRWLQTKANWLLIFDNLDEICIAHGGLPPLHSSGHVLITTRNNNCDGIPAEGVEILPMNSSESVSLLLTRSKLQDDPREEVTAEAGKIVAELGHLPLAVEQAAAYIRSSQSIFEYLSTYCQNRKQMLYDKPQGNHLYQESVATTWKMSFHRLQTTNPNSIKLIEILAFLSSDEIPIEFLKAGKTGLGPDFDHILRNDFYLRQSLRGLESYSLIRIWGNGQKITIHRLVQSVIKDNLDINARGFMNAQTVQMALSAFPHTVEGKNRATCRMYSSQVTAILANNKGQQSSVDSRSGNHLEWVWLAEQLASYLFHDGYYSDSLIYIAECLDIKKTVLGPEHPSTMRSMNGVAAVYNNLGRLNEAVKVHEECLKTRMRVLGLEHPDTLWSMNGLAAIYHDLGRWNEAVKVHEECLEIRKRVLGLEHPDTLWSMSGLAVAYHSLRQLNEAVKVHEECLKTRKRVLGPEHPNTLWSKNNLPDVDTNH
jgi:Tetratricopeptide repeat/NB-ARC domain/Heterokaryon incompatibility protein (HET)